MSDQAALIIAVALTGGAVVMLGLYHATRTPPPKFTATITMPKIGDPLMFTDGMIENVSAHPAVTNGLLMILTQELRAIRATMEATTGIAIRPVVSADTEPSAATPDTNATSDPVGP